MYKDKLYLKPVGGLCNRMRTVDTAATLVEKLEKRLVVFWGRDIYLNCRYCDLFKASTYFDVIEENQWLGRKALFPYLPGSTPSSSFRSLLYSFTKSAYRIENEIWFEDFEEALASLSAEVKPESMRNMKEFEEMSFAHITPLLTPLYGRGNAFICTAWKLVPEHNYARHFVPIESLMNRINKTASNYSTTIGVHIRRGDHRLATAYSSLEKFTSIMRQELDYKSDSTFYLTTDCKQTEEQLLRQFPNKILTSPKSSYDRNTAGGIQDALVDLYALSKTKKILGSYYSSFSEVAAAISDIEEVTVC